jgi:hypothetical protein
LLTRTAIARAVGGFEDAIHDLYEDQVFLAKLVLAGPVYVESGCRERYRQHPWSSSAQAIASGQYHPVRAHPSRGIYLQWLATYLTQHGLMRGMLARRMRRALRPYQSPCINGPIERLTTWLYQTFRDRGV